ncbi:hypothetical protein [Pseudomonas sp. CGJS7]|uniref:hypothetical protein n=1 Tax=Pseudomonas sp. CGJS7 TaxID=3109348 RepID=UPI00300B8A6B
MLSRWVFSLSWQEASAGRNLITLFLTVNNPGDFFSGPKPGTAPPPTARAPSPIARAHRRRDNAFRSTSLKPKRGAGFSALTFFDSIFFRNRARVRRRVEGVLGDLYRKKKFLFAAVPDFASHKPDCAKVRELFSAATTARTPPRASATGRGRPRTRLPIPERGGRERGDARAWTARIDAVPRRSRRARSYRSSARTARSRVVVRTRAESESVYADPRAGRSMAAATRGADVGILSPHRRGRIRGASNRHAKVAARVLRRPLRSAFAPPCPSPRSPRAFTRDTRFHDDAGRLRHPSPLPTARWFWSPRVVATDRWRLAESRAKKPRPHHSRQRASQAFGRYFTEDS